MFLPFSRLLVRDKDYGLMIINGNQDGISQATRRPFGFTYTTISG
jgi:hypothetical protein